MKDYDTICLSVYCPLFPEEYIPIHKVMANKGETPTIEILGVSALSAMTV